MQGSFEKDVQRKLDELRLTPSAPVWEKIEMEIAPEEKKRRGLFWLLPLGLLLAGAGGWWLLQSSSENLSGTANKLVVTQPSDKTSPEPSRTSEDKTAPTSPTAPLSNPVESFQSGSEKNTVSFSVPKHKTAPAFAGFEKKARTQRQKQWISNSSATKTKRQPPNAVMIDPPVEEKLVGETTEPTSIRTSDEKTTTLPVPAESDSVTKAKMPEEGLPGRNDSVLKKKVASAGKWRRQVGLTIGLNSVVQTVQTNSFLSNSFNSPSTGSVAPTMPGTSPAVKAGFGFAADFSLLKNLGRRWEFGVGLQYAYASSQQKVGDEKKVDTTFLFAQDRLAASGFYTNTGQGNYTNRYHQLQVPVSITYKTLGRLPFFFTVGAAYGRLLGSNALTFNSTSNVYYRNKANNNRSLLPLFSSAQVALFSKSKTSLRTGPFVQYQLPRLQKEDNGSSGHLLFAGLKTTIIF